MECRHDICTCQANDESGYCSPSCRTGVEGADKCFCGHDACKGMQV